MDVYFPPRPLFSQRGTNLLGVQSSMVSVVVREVVTIPRCVVTGYYLLSVRRYFDGTARPGQASSRPKDKVSVGLRESR